MDSSSVFNNYMQLACCIVMVLIPLSKFIIIFFMSKSYLDAYRYVGILYLGSLFSSFSGFYGTGYISAKDTKNAMKTTLVGAIINFVINLVLIPIIGIWAACISTVCGNIVVWMIRIKDTKKYFQININWKKFSSIMVINVIFTIGICFANILETILMLVVSVAISILVNRDIVIKIFITIKEKIGGKVR